MIDDANLDQFEQKILANVAEFGCHVTTVFDPQGDDPSFTYSAGFAHTLDQGEVIVFGLSHDLMHFIVNETMRQCRNGLQLEDWGAISGLVEGFDLVARSIPPSKLDREHFNSAMWLHRREFGIELTRAFQLVWPGAADGLFPWNKDSSESVREWQPALYERGIRQ